MEIANYVLILINVMYVKSVILFNKRFVITVIQIVLLVQNLVLNAIVVQKINR